MPSSFCLADLTFPDIQEYLRRSDLILIPMASTEQHGPHLPLCTDSVTAYEVSRRAAEQAGVLYTPTVWTGYSPQHMRGPGQGTGTITVRAETLTQSALRYRAQPDPSRLQQADFRQRPRLQRQGDRPAAAPHPLRHRRTGGVL